MKAENEACPCATCLIFSEGKKWSVLRNYVRYEQAFLAGVLSGIFPWYLWIFWFLASKWKSTTYIFGAPWQNLLPQLGPFLAVSGSAAGLSQQSNFHVIAAKEVFLWFVFSLSTRHMKPSQVSNWRSIFRTNSNHLASMVMPLYCWHPLLYLLSVSRSQKYPCPLCQEHGFSSGFAFLFTWRDSKPLPG